MTQVLEPYRAFSGRLRDKGAPPEDIAPVISWLETATIPVADLADLDTGSARAIMARISSKQNGKPAAANTANRKRAVLNNLMKYASSNENCCQPTRWNPSPGPGQENSRPLTRDV